MHWTLASILGMFDWPCPCDLCAKRSGTNYVLLSAWLYCFQAFRSIKYRLCLYSFMKSYTKRHLNDITNNSFRILLRCKKNKTISIGVIFFKQDCKLLYLTVLYIFICGVCVCLGSYMVSYLFIYKIYDNKNYIAKKKLYIIIFSSLTKRKNL